MCDKKNKDVSNAKWFKRGFHSKQEYIGWLQFNDLVDESFSYDDVYYDDYSGKTINLNSVSPCGDFCDDEENNLG